MSNLEKIADLFQKEVGNEDVFGKISYTEESERLRLLAGKLYYKAEKDPDKARSSKLKDVAKMILRASEMMRNA